MRINQVLSSEEISAFLRKSDLRGAWEVTFTLGVLAGTFWASAVIGPWFWPVAVVLLGGRFLAFAILMHECAHDALFRTRWLNRLVGHFSGLVIWNRLDAYRKHHLGHHGWTGTDKDPDKCLVDPFPTTRKSLLRKCARDLLGLTGLKRLIGMPMMDAGIIGYTVSGNARRADPRPSRGTILRNLARRTLPVLVFQSAIAVFFWSIGHFALFGLWALAWMTTFSLFIRLRAIAEHACTEWSSNVFKNTRTTYANPIARLVVAPHRVNYHLEHHLLPTAPCYRLRAMHELLNERKALGDSPIAEGYFEVFATATTRELAAATS
jgi:fatty acid desaturase